MHPNPIYRGRPAALNLDFAAQRGFGTLAVNGPDGPLIAHVPFIMTESGAVDFHLMRSNPVARALVTPQPAVLAVMGPDGYVSPDWYGMEDQVPTWNYVAVHLRGRAELLPDGALLPLLDRLSDAFEARLLPKPIWKTAKVSPETMARFMRMILPVRMTVEAIDGTWKLAQNKPDSARLGAADGVAASGVGAELQALAALMRDPPAKAE